MIRTAAPFLAHTLLATRLAFAADTAEMEADFSSPPPDNWQRFDPLVQFGLNLTKFEVADGVCRLSCEVPPPEVLAIFGYAASPRLGWFAPQVFTDCASSIDILEWQPTNNRATDVSFLSVMTRVTDPAGLGTAGGYAFSLEILPSDTAEAVLYRSVNEVPIALLRTPPFALDPARDYRLLLVSRGTTHTGRLFALDDLATPLIDITAEDATFTSGRAGFTLISDRPNPITATFDNFLAWDGRPAPVAIRPGLAPQTVELVTDARRAIASTLEASPTLDESLQPWFPPPLESTRIEGPNLVEIVSSAPQFGPTWFFRRRTL